MGKKQTVEALIEGGKASAAPPLGPALGPLGVNIGQIISEINKKTADFKGMKVPVKIIVDIETKTFEINIGTPPVSQLIAKEINVQKGSGVPNKNKIGNVAMEQIIKIAKMKKESMLVNSLKSAVKNVIGSANSMGVLIENKKAVDINADIDNGTYDEMIASGKTEASTEKLKELSNHLTGVQNIYKLEQEKIKAEQEAKAAAAAAIAGAAAAPGEEKKESAKVEEKPPGKESTGAKEEKKAK